MGLRKEIVPAGGEAFIQGPAAESEVEKDAPCEMSVDGLRAPCGQRGAENQTVAMILHPAASCTPKPAFRICVCCCAEWKLAPLCCRVVSQRKNIAQCVYPFTCSWISVTIWLLCIKLQMNVLVQNLFVEMPVHFTWVNI